MANMVDIKKTFESYTRLAPVVSKLCGEGAYQDTLQEFDRRSPQFKQQFPRQRWVLDFLITEAERWHYVACMISGGFTEKDLRLLWFKADQLELQVVTVGA